MDLLKQLKDIKPNAEITDYGFYAAVGISVVAAVLLFLLIYFLLKNRKQNPYLTKLKNLEFNNPKKTAYEFKEYAKHFVNETNEKLYEEICKELENHKYKPEVEDLSEELILKIKKFTEEIK
ncbi:hypothetical protein [Nautilia sp.]